MKTLKTISLFSSFILLLFLTQTSFAQVRIGGGVSIDIGFPEVVVVNKPQRRVPQPKRIPPRRVPDHRKHRKAYRSLGEVSNHFRGNQIVQQVADVQVYENRNGIIDVKTYLQGGDVLSFTLENNNYHDVNYHCNAYNRGNRHSNNILEVRFNGEVLPLRDGSISFQPKGRSAYNVVLNLHNGHGDSFHGNYSTY